jgi:hypothetical protein
MTADLVVQQKLRRALLEDHFPDSEEFFESSPFARAVPDKLKFERNVAVASWIERASGKATDPGAPDWQAAKDATAQGFFGLSGRNGVSDEEIHSLIRTHVQTADDAVAEGARAGMAGKAQIAALQGFEGKRGPSPLRGTWGRYSTEFQRNYQAAAMKRAGYSDLIDEAAAIIQQEGDSNAPVTDSFESVASRIIAEVPEVDRRFVISAIGATAADIPDQQRTYLSKLAAGFGRAAEAQAAGGKSLLSTVLAAGAMAEDAEARKPVDTNQYMEDERKRREYYLLSNMVRRTIEEGAPLDVDGWAAETGLGLARMAPMTIAAFVPVAGPGSMLGYMRDNVATDLLQQNPGMSMDEADGIALVAAPPMAAIEFVADRLPFKQFPVVGRFLKQGMTSLRSAVTRGGARIIGGTGAEIGEELAQHQIPLYLQELANVLNQEVGGVDWHERNKELAKLPGEVFGPALVMSIIGAGGASISGIKDGRRLAADRELLIATGASPSLADEITQAATGGDWRTVDTLLGRAVEGKGTDAATPEQRMEAALSIQKREEQSAQNDRQQMRDAGVSIRKAAEGWEVTSLNDGAAVTLPTHEDAMTLVRSQLTAQDVQRDEATMAAFSAFSQGAKDGESFTISDRQLTLLDKFAAAEAKGDKASMDAIYERLEMERQKQGNPELQMADLRVLGESVVEFKEGVASYASRIHDGGRAIDLVEEKAETDLKRWVATGRTSMADMADRIRAVEAITGDTYLQGGTEQAVIEAYSDLARLWATGTRKGNAVSGAVRGQEARVMRQQRANLRKAEADAKAAPIIQALKDTAEFFRQVLRQAGKLIKAKKDGKLGDIEQFLNESVGLTAEALHVEGVAKEAKVIGGATFSLPLSNLTEAEKHLRSLANKPLTTTDGLTATVSNNAAGKMASHSATRKSASMAAHLAAIADFERLFTAGKVAESAPDRANDPNIPRMHRVHSLMPFQGRELTVKFTVKEIARDGNRIYSIEAMDLSGAPSAGQSAHDTTGAAAREAPITDGANKDVPKDGAGQASMSLAPTARLEAIAKALGETGKAKPQARRDMLTRAQEMLTRAQQAWELVGREAASAASETNAEATAVTEDLARLRADFDIDMRETREERELELGGAKQDKAGREALERIRREFDNRLKQRRIEYERDRADLNAKLAAIDAATGKQDAIAARNARTAAIRTLDAVLSVLPPEVRGRVGGFAKLSELTTETALMDEIERRFAKIGPLLEGHFKRELLRDIEKLLEKAEATKGENRVLTSKIGAEAQRDVDGILAVKDWSKDKLAEELTGLEAKLEAADAPEALQEAFQQWSIANTFGALEDRTAAELAAAVEILESIYDNGRARWKALQEDFRAEALEHRQQGIADLGNRVEADDVEMADMMARQKKHPVRFYLSGFAQEHLAFEQILQKIFGAKSPTAAAFAKLFYGSTNAYSDAIAKRRDTFTAALSKAWGITGLDKTRKFNRVLERLGEMRKNSGVFRTFGRSTEERSMDIAQAERVITDEAFAKSLGLQPAEVLKIEEALFAATDRQRVVHWEKVIHGGERKEQPMSELQAVHYLLSWAQPDVKERMEKQGWDIESVDAMKALLSPEAKAVMGFLQQQYAAGYSRLNPVYQRVYGMDMPRVSNYAPTFYEVSNQGEGANPFTGSTDTSGLAAGFVKSRNQKHNARLRQVNALEAYWSHVAQAEYWIAFAENLKMARAVLCNVEVTTTVKAKHGDYTTSYLGRWLEALNRNGQRKASDLMATSRLLTNLQRAYVGQALGMKIGVLMKQASAAVGSLIEIPARHWVPLYWKLISGQISVAKIFKAQTIQRRLVNGFSPEVRAAMARDGMNTGRFVELIDAALMPIGYVDAAFTTLSASIAYQHHFDQAIKGGMKEADAQAFAMEEMDRVVHRTAQPAETVDRSLRELETQGPAKLLYLFATEARQKVAMDYRAVSELIRGQNKADNVRKIFVIHFVMPIITQTMANLYKDLFTSAGDEEDDDSNWEAMDYLRAMILGPVNGVFLVGQGIEAAVTRVLGQRTFETSNNPLAEAVANLDRKLGRSEPFNTEDAEAIARDARSYLQTAGNFGSVFGSYGAAAAGIVLSPVVDVLGFAKNVSKD